MCGCGHVFWLLCRAVPSASARRCLFSERRDFSGTPRIAALGYLPKPVRVVPLGCIVKGRFNTHGRTEAVPDTTRARLACKFEGSVANGAHQAREPVRFGAFDVDFKSVELRKQGARVKLQEQ